jgi:processive 1,2-diacylglycerol beta-glucosyltransferase
MAMRVLITTVTAGGGHLAAAAALEEAWRASRPEDVVEKIDVLQFCSSLERNVHAKGYAKLVEHAPELWGMLFKRTDDPKLTSRLSRLKRALPSVSRSRFKRFLKKFQPDIVLCTHYLPLETLGKMRHEEDLANGRRAGGDAGRGRSASPLVVTIVTDFEAHALWMDGCVDLYCVAAEETKARLIARGAPAGGIVATGIPISAKFSGPIDQKTVRKNMGWREDLPIVLVLSGGFGMGPVAEILRELDKVARPFQTIVVAGKNEELRRELAAQDRKHPTGILGFTKNMHELMAVADLIISKPGGLTTSEALAMGKPLLILNPIPGQEAANSDFLLQHGAAAKVNREEDLPFRIEQLLGAKKLAELAKAARALGRPEAARAICTESVARARQRLSTVNV